MLYWNKLLDPERIRPASSEKKSKNDTRSPFKKDFDTICNSTILRRLQDKAQVFPLEEEDYARTRLTHSIEVMSVAENLGIQACRTVTNRSFKQYLLPQEMAKDRSCVVEVNKRIKNIPTILMAASLLHDMGNPPFGHLGEQVINDWFSDELKHYEYKSSEGKFGYVDSSNNTLDHVLTPAHQADLVHFDGNAQLLRLVSKLSLVVDENGMNLSFPVLATFIKYPTSSLECGADKLSMKKAGYFQSEKELFLQIAETLGLQVEGKVCRHPLAFLLEAADDIAYLTADIEDASHKGIITLRDIELYLNTYAEKDPLSMKVCNAIKRYQNQAQNLGYPNTDDYIMHRLRVFIKGQMIDAMSEAFKKSYREIMNGSCEVELIQYSGAAKLAGALRELEKEKIHYCSDIMKSKTRSTVIIKKLLESYVPAILNYDQEIDKGKDTINNMIYSSFSENYRYMCELNNKNVETEMETYNKLRLVIDQIAGMTDSRAMSAYKMLTAN